jgi:hypothetical protein
VKRRWSVSATQRGERVKSRAEQRIADYLSSRNIRYSYEKTLQTFPVIGQKISRPDFYLEDYNVYVEYWGLVNVPDKRKREGYVRAMKWKMAQYHEHGIRFISLYPKNMDNLDWVFSTKFKEVTGLEMPKLVDASRDHFCSKCGAPIITGSNYCGKCGNVLVPNNTSTQTGFCIRQGERIAFNVERPLCETCYKQWTKFGNRVYSEKYCHSCGGHVQTSYAKPVCLECYKKLHEKSA